MSISHLPPEIWTEILKEAIDVPLFLEANFLQRNRPERLREYFYELPYWQSERVRNSLRRVCRDWDEFLKQFDHRYVRLTDAYHERVPKDAIRRAIRIDTSVDWGCECDDYRQEWTCLKGRDSNCKGVFRVMVETMIEDPNQALGHWKLRILVGSISSKPALIKAIRRYAPNLGSIIGLYFSLDFLSDRVYTFISELLPKSHHLSNQSPLTFSYLTAWSLTTLDLNLPFQNCKFPSLRYLHLWSIENHRHNDPMAAIEAILKVTGENLQTFILVYARIYQSISDEVWLLAPKLEVVELPCHWTRGPPSGHPLRTIRVSLQIIDEDGEILGGDFSPRTKEFIPGMGSNSWFRNSGLEVRSNILWREIIFLYPRLSPALWLTECYASINIKFSDAEEITFNQYIVFLIGAYWKGKQGNRHFPKTVISPPMSL